MPYRPELPLPIEQDRTMSSSTPETPKKHAKHWQPYPTPVSGGRTKANTSFLDKVNQVSVSYDDPPSPTPRVHRGADRGLKREIGSNAVEDKDTKLEILSIASSFEAPSSPDTESSNGSAFNPDYIDSDSEYDEKPALKGKGRGKRGAPAGSLGGSKLITQVKKPRIVTHGSGGSTSRKGNGGSVGSGGGGGAKGSAWSGDEDLALFNQLYPRASVKWAEVAANVGGARDAKSCQNRAAVLAKKLPGLVKSMSGH